MGSTSAASDLSRLTLEIVPPIASITLHHPPLNVIDIPMIEELAQSLAEIEARPDVLGSRSQRSGQSIFRRRGCGRSYSR